MFFQVFDLQGSSSSLCVPMCVIVHLCIFLCRQRALWGASVNRGWEQWQWQKRRDGDKDHCLCECGKKRFNLNSADKRAPAAMHAGNMVARSPVLLTFLQKFNLQTKNSLLSIFLAFLFDCFLPYTRGSLILSLQFYPPVFSLVIKSCQPRPGLHSIILERSYIWWNPEESRRNTHHLLSTKYAGGVKGERGEGGGSEEDFCPISLELHSILFINYHITKEEHLLCMACCLGARSNSPL